MTTHTGSATAISKPSSPVEPAPKAVEAVDSEGGWKMAGNNRAYQRTKSTQTEVEKDNKAVQTGVEKPMKKRRGCRLVKHRGLRRMPNNVM